MKWLKNGRSCFLLEFANVFPLKLWFVWFSSKFEEMMMWGLRTLYMGWVWGQVLLLVFICNRQGGFSLFIWKQSNILLSFKPTKRNKRKLGELNGEDACSTEGLTTCCSLFLLKKSQKFLLNILGIWSWGNLLKYCLGLDYHSRLKINLIFFSDL